MNSATFEANPSSDHEPWIEKPAIEGLKFRIWHLMFFSLCAFGLLVVLICCCVRVRVPRTKQEIEGDYKRKKITRKFRKRLKFISNQDMEAINLMKDVTVTNENENLVTVEQLKKSNFGKKVANMMKMGHVPAKQDCSKDI